MDIQDHKVIRRGVALFAAALICRPTESEGSKSAAYVVRQAKEFLAFMEGA